MYIVECWIEYPVQKLNRTYTYLSDEPCERGTRVLIPFGKQNLTGFAESCVFSEKTKEEIEEEKGMSLKKISGILDPESLITPELHSLAFHMADITLSTVISCFGAMLPGKVKPGGKTKTTVKERWVKVLDSDVSLTPKQEEAYQAVKSAGRMKYSELRKQYPSIAKVLLEKGALEEEVTEREAEEMVSAASDQKPILTVQQEAALKEIHESDDTVYLLKGVTGSGKTEVYLRLAEEALSSGKQVLFLVPEIGLTPQMIARVSARFQKGLAIYHSGLSDQEKYEQYRMVKTGRASIVVGTRSAVFLPFQSLGLIVLDEEHDPSYKQENQPCYHARDIAMWRSEYHHCKMILGSATPSLDSYARALKKVYHLVRLDERISEGLPEVKVVNTREMQQNGVNTILSPLLIQKMGDNLKAGHQTILLLNRRGYHARLVCRECGEALTCPHCDLAMSYHRDIKKMKCHTCGTEINVPRQCPECGSTKGFTTLGFGTEMLENEVHMIFPSARIVRMDRDTTSRKNSHQKLLESFGKGEADILLGTQMIAKGLDFPNVTLVGIINGDDGLRRTDFRSCEASFDLLVQASGRSGRSGKKGEVVMQVNDPDHYAVQCAAVQNYDAFFVQEMQFRRAGQYPPYTYLIGVTFVEKDQSLCDRNALAFKEALSGNFTVLGVISLLKIQDRYRSRIILKGKNLDEMRLAVKRVLEDGNVNTDHVRIDVNPMVLD